MLNVPLISVTRDVSQPEKSMEVSETHSPNIFDMFVTCEVSQLERSMEVSEEHAPNMPSMFMAPEVSRAERFADSILDRPTKSRLASLGALTPARTSIDLTASQSMP